MNKEEFLKFLESLHSRGSSLGLERVEKAALFLGNPQFAYKTVHVAGTNGKGSTAAMLESMLIVSGKKTGLLTSPHLKEFNERIRVDWKPAPYEELARIAERIKQVDEQHSINLTYFEFVSLLAFQYFKEQGVEYAVVEVGLGGRLDATNIVKPEIAIITPIDFDHMHALGNRIEKIAFEKAGIIKTGCKVVISPQKEEALKVITQVAKIKGAELFPSADYVSQDFINFDSSNRMEFEAFIGEEKFENLKIPLIGWHQVENACTALAAARLLGVLEKDIRKGLLNVKWSARTEIVERKPLTIVDSAHNPHGINALVKMLSQLFPGKKVFLVFGLSYDWKIEPTIKLLAPLAEKAFVSKAKFKSVDSKKISEEFKKHGVGTELFSTPEKAFEEAKKQAGERGIVVATGSIYFIGEML